MFNNKHKKRTDGRSDGRTVATLCLIAAAWEASVDSTAPIWEVIFKWSRRYMVEALRLMPPIQKWWTPEK